MASVEEHVILLSYLCHTGAGGVFYHGDFGHKKESMKNLGAAIE